MSASWKTKWGMRQVRHEPPTLAEAFAAAACLTEDRERQAGIAAELMGVTVAAAKAEAARLARSDERATVTVAAPGRNAPPRTVVIERRPARRFAAGAPLRDGGTPSPGAPRPGMPVRPSTGLRSR